MRVVDLPAPTTLQRQVLIRLSFASPAGRDGWKIGEVKLAR
jgi:hypothetical protein